MRDLSCFLYFSGENPGHRVFREGEPKRDFLKSNTVKLKGEKWINEEGESTAEAKALADQIDSEIESIKNGTNEKLAELYVDVFQMVPLQDSLKMSETIVGDKYKNKGLLAVLEGEMSLLKLAFTHVEDLRLLAYGNLFKELANPDNGGMDANFLPLGSTVKVKDGKVTVTYPNGKTASALIFPWDVSKIAHEKYVEMQREKAKKAGEEIAARRASGAEEVIDLGDDEEEPAPARTEPAKRVEKAVEEPVPPVEAKKAESKPDFKAVPVMPEVVPEAAPEINLSAEWTRAVEPRIQVLRTEFAAKGVTIEATSQPWGPPSRKIKITNGKETYEVTIRPKKGAKSYDDSKSIIAIRQHTQNHTDEERFFEVDGEKQEYTGIDGIEEAARDIADVLARRLEPDKEKPKAKHEKPEVDP